MIVAISGVTEAARLKSSAAAFADLKKGSAVFSSAVSTPHIVRLAGRENRRI